MSVYPRRFLVWTRTNLYGGDQGRGFAEGVLFTDGTVVVRYSYAVPTSVVFPERGLDALYDGAGFGGPCEIEWLDGRHG